MITENTCDINLNNIRKKIDRMISKDLFELSGNKFIPRYSQSIGPAWEVVDKMQELGWDIKLDWHEDSEEKEKPWKIAFKKSVPYRFGCYRHKSAPLAICKAALGALNDESELADEKHM